MSVGVTVSDISRQAQCRRRRERVVVYRIRAAFFAGRLFADIDVAPTHRFVDGIEWHSNIFEP